MLSEKDLKRTLHMCLLRNQFYDAALSAMGYALLHEAYESKPELKDQGCPLGFKTDEKGKIILPDGEWDSLRVESADCCVGSLKLITDKPAMFVEYIAAKITEVLKIDTGYEREVARESIHVALISDPESFDIIVRLVYCTVSTKEPT